METVRLKRCRHGTFCFFPHDIYIGRSLDMLGEYVEDEVQLLLKLIKPGDIVVEIGANIGADTVPLARAVGNAGRVLALEPQRIIYQMLCANLSINGIWNVEAYQRAAGAAEGVMGVPPVDYSQSSNFGSVALVQQSNEPVRVVALDSLQLQRCELLKIDVEGMERDVLDGAAETIKRVRPIIYIENDRKSKSQALIEKLFDLDYACWWHVPSMYRPDNYNGWGADPFGKTASVNMVCFPRERGINVTDLKHIESSAELAPGVIYQEDAP
jgi:FkbM family methyltransferase